MSETTPHTTDPKDQQDRGSARPDLTPPPSSPEPDHDALNEGLEKLDAVKPY